MSVYLLTNSHAGGGYSVVSIARSKLGDTNAADFNGAGESWCADFVSWVYKQAGVPFWGQSGNYWQIHFVGYSGDTTARNDNEPNGSMVGYFRGSWQYFTNTSYNRTYHPMEAGDVVTYDWNNDGTGDHTGIFEHFNSDGTFNTIEGNTSGPGGPGVFEKTRNFDNVMGWGHMPGIGVRDGNNAAYSSSIKVHVEMWWTIGSNSYYDYENVNPSGGTVLDLDETKGTNRGNNQYRGDMLRTSGTFPGPKWYLYIRKRATSAALSNVKVQVSAFGATSGDHFTDFEMLTTTSGNPPRPTWSGHSSDGAGLKILQFTISTSHCYPDGMYTTCTGDMLRSG